MAQLKAPSPWGKFKSRSARNAAWIEKYCRIPEGKFVGRPVKLTEEQRAWLAMIYDTPTRTFILSMGRKNAKTAFAAFLLLLHLCGPEHRLNSQLYSAAQSRDQAAVICELAAKIVRLSPDLHAHVGIRDTAKELFCPELGTLYKALSAEVSTSFGKSPVFVVHDELGQVKGPRSPLFEALETAFAAQEEPLSVVISTQASTDGDLLSIMIDDALADTHPPEVKCILYSAPMDLDPFDEETIRLANPHYDVFMNKAEVRTQAESARRMRSKEPSYRNLILNQRVEARAPFVSRTTWKANGRKMSRPLDGREVFVGLDLSAVADLTAAVSIAQCAGTRDWDVEPTFWLPEEGLVERAKEDRVPYDLWHEEGFLHVTEGRSIRYEFVASWLRELFDRANVRKVGFDRAYMKFLKPWLEKAAFTEEELERFVEIGQGYMSMGPALRILEQWLVDGQLRHGDHPVLTMCAFNARVIEDEARNRKFVKATETARIDGMVALAQAAFVAESELLPAPSGDVSVEVW